ncbi:agmatinase [Colwellia sp. 6M3]|jgi:agmatinase|nr:agmatinase [Colwellia sp. Arc7-D]MBA6415703.1 agmatinase [Colwellia sp. 6M3]
MPCHKIRYQGKNMTDNQAFKVALLGIPFDDNSSFERGPALAPSKIREVLNNGSLNGSTELGINLRESKLWLDAGNVEITSSDNFIENIEQRCDELLAQNTRLVTLGGDHSISYPILKSYRKYFDKLSILHIDAHSDLYDSFKGNRYSNACPFARVMEDGLCDRLVQVGIRTLNLHQTEQIKKFNVESLEMRNWPLSQPLKFDHPVYLSLDIDGIDPAFAPGVSHREPGGLTTREVINLIHQINMPLVGADIVEYNPNKDIDNMTSQLAAKLVKEVAGKMLSIS